MRSLKHLFALQVATQMLLASFAVPSTSAQELNAEGLAPKASVIKEQIDSLLKAGDPVAARKVLEESLDSKSLAIKTESDISQIHNLHYSIAFGFYRKQENAEAVDELMKTFDNFMRCPDTLRKAGMLFLIAETMNLFGMRCGKDVLIAEKIDQAIECCRRIEAENAVDVQFALSSLVLMRAKRLLQRDKSMATDMLVKQINALKAINATDNATEQTIAAQFRLLAAAGYLVEDFDDRAEIERLLISSMSAFPESARVLNEFAGAEYEAVWNLASDNPAKAATRLEYAVKKLSLLSKDSDDLRQMLDQIKALAKKIDATSRQQDMIGKPAPDLKFAAWANVDDFNVDDLKGKVVLYDFWAVWCDPCIDTFTHLRTWRKECGDKRFEIVGITKYYNYEWNEVTGRASHSEKEVAPEAERDAITRFLQAMEIKHPIVFTANDTTLWRDYGVSGIPHAVLVDRNGIVQMVSVGSGQENAEALLKKIKELIAQ